MYNRFIPCSSKHPAGPLHVGECKHWVPPAGALVGYLTHIGTGELEGNTVEVL